MRTDNKIFFDDGEAGWDEMWSGIRRKIIGYDERLMLVKVRFDKGAVAAMHHHPHSQTAYIAEGKFEVVIGDEKKILKAGDGFYIPPGVEHGVTALEEGLVIDTFSPAREDFLKS